LSSNYQPRGFGRFSLFPPVIKNLLIINAAVFFVQIIMDNISFNGYPAAYILNRWFALNPIGGFDFAGYPFNFQIWQLITYQFMHGGFGHIFFNMFALWMFGAEVEYTLGSKKFLIFYLFSGITAGLLHLFISPLLGSPLAVTIGASGAVFGVMTAFAMLFPDRYIFLYFLIPVKSKYLIGFLIVFEFLAIDSAASNVAHLAHLGGALFGFLFILFDKSNQVEFRNLFKKSYYYKKKTPSDFGSFPFGKREEEDVQEAKYYDLNKKDEEETITQEEIDAILDKISKYGYQRLTEREKRILFEASKKMK
jgi:membrane associated rhomboid family serine protease